MPRCVHTIIIMLILIGLCVVLLNRWIFIHFSSESKQFCIATTHLLYNPKAGEVKLAQLSCLLAEMHKMATVHSEPQIVYSICVHV